MNEKFPLLLLLLLPTAHAQGTGRDDAHLHFARLSDSGPRGVVTLGFGPTDYADMAERHELGSAFRMRAFPLPGQRQVDLVLRPVSVMEPGARARAVQADGSETSIDPQVRCFSGYVDGGGPAFLGITRKAVNGYLTVDGELYFLSPGENPSGLVSLAHASQTGGPLEGFCGAENQFLAPEGGRELASVGPVLRTAPVFIEADDDYRARFLSDQACVDYTTLLLTAVSEIYRRDIGARLTIPDGFLRVWNTQPPWGAVTNFSHLSKVYNWWTSTANPNRGLVRASVHLFTHPIFGGTSRGVGGLCRNDRAYEISSLSGRFPYPVVHAGRENWDLFVVSHEFGHTFGSMHSSLYTPPIECADGSGPDSGTIMSYCHLDYGIANVGMRFHLREQSKIRGTLSGPVCLTAQTLTRGDYDADGDVDFDDLAAAEGVASQGFRSLGAEEVFDLDADGDYDKVDLDSLTALVNKFPPASAVARNGSGVNPACFSALNKPVLGQTWRSQVLADGVGRGTLVLGYADPMSGVFSPYGELLGRTPAYGGVQLYYHYAPSTGTAALHEIPLALDPAMIGRTVAMQGVVLGPTASVARLLCNAIDVRFSLY